MPENEDIHFGMKKLGLRNWCEPDVPKHFPGLTEDKWVPVVMEPKLISTVPEDVVRLFEIARGSILYGWFFYPLLTLAEEQLYRVQEAAVRERCKLAGIPLEVTRKGKGASRRFADLIRELAARGFISADAVDRWEAVRKLRNWSSHPQRPTIVPPGMVIEGIDATARMINQLFADNPAWFSLLGQRVRKATGLGDAHRQFPVVAGIDVGETEKGYHLVALKGAEVLGCFTTTEAAEATRWCKERNALYIGVDAPCAWRGEDHPREAERILRQMGYSLYPTPTRKVALQNPTYAWMLNGEKLYQALQLEYPLIESIEAKPPFCFETYPYATSCAYMGRKLDADDKNQDRRQILRTVGIDDSGFANIDFVDAAICALVGCSVSIDYCTAIGLAADGFMVFPPWL
jgi:predicted nuclease with RNAse H fold